MNNLTTKFIFLLMLFIGFGCSVTKDSHSIASCFENSSKMQVAKIDSDNHRLFAVYTGSEAQGRIELSKSCFKNSGWEKSWRVSVFSHKKYAGYKDDPNITPLHKDNAWAKAYLGEYISEDKKYLNFPALQPIQNH